MSVTRIQNGTIVDPTNHAESFTGDLWIQDGKIVDPPPNATPESTIDASGQIVMPGGVDIHSHFAGPKVNASRKIIARACLDRSSRSEHDAAFVPDVVTTGRRYAGLGYTTAFDAAVPPLFARQAQMEIEDLPYVDAGFYALVGNHRYMLQAVADGDSDRIEQFLGYIINKTGAYAPKIVNPGGVEQWKSGLRNRVKHIDDRITEFDITPREIITSLAQAANRINLPHPIHIHCNRLGLPGNWRTTLATMEALGDHRGHLAHVQFHSYRGADDETRFASAAGPLVEFVNHHKNVSVDIGQVMFGSTMSMTADSPLGYYLQKISGRPWISFDTEQECGCGISPITYKNENRVHALQWAIGLEWLLLAEDPWQLALSTDHPNGASFLAYPQIIALLMDAELRKEHIHNVHADVLRHSVLNEIDREYSLEEIAIITRSAPAKMLGLCSKGHLGSGADADISIYNLQSDRQQMFAFPRMVIKGGQVIVDDGEPRSEVENSRLISADIGDCAENPDYQSWCKENYTTIGS